MTTKLKDTHRRIQTYCHSLRPLAGAMAHQDSVNEFRHFIPHELSPSVRYLRPGMLLLLPFVVV